MLQSQEVDRKPRAIGESPFLFRESLDFRKSWSLHRISSLRNKRRQQFRLGDCFVAYLRKGKNKFAHVRELEPDFFSFTDIQRSDFVRLEEPRGVFVAHL